MNQKLAVDIFNVRAHRVQADQKAAGYLIVRETLGHQVQDFQFAI